MIAAIVLVLYTIFKEFLKNAQLTYAVNRLIMVIAITNC